MKKYKHGLTIGRYQPLHSGHIELIEKMINECEQTTIVVGSLIEERTERNPFFALERFAMLKNYFGEKIILQGIADINNLEKWPEYVLSTIKGVDAFYSGSKKDIYPFNKIPDLNIIMLDRSQTSHKSGSKLRELLEVNNNEWKNYVPECNWNLVQKCWLKYKNII